MISSNIFICAITAGLIMFIILEIDKRYFCDAENAKQYSSLRIASLVSLIVWAICAYQQNELIGQVPALKIEHQKILTDPF
jgi:hypothetical protein